MVKFKTSSLAKLPKEQRCQLVVAPINSWFMPSTSDMWTQPARENPSSNSTIQYNSCSNKMDCDLQDTPEDEHPDLSFFAYGSIGCFCYGEIYHSLSSRHIKLPVDQSKGNNLGMHPIPKNLISATVNRLIDVKDDNSRISCLRFLKNSIHPYLMALTENGSFLVHDCLVGDNLIQLKKGELLSKVIDNSSDQSIQTALTNTEQQHRNKKARFNINQQINSFVWPHARHMFLGLSFPREKTNKLIWFRLRDIYARGNENPSDATMEFFDSIQSLNLELATYSSPICCMESAPIDSESHLIAVAMDDGLIVIVRVSLIKGQDSRVIKLARHNDQISSMSLFTENQSKFPMGLLASVSRSGLVLIWDIENEFYFADYLAINEAVRNNQQKINWFALSFMTMKGLKQVHLAVSNCESGLTIIELPENTRSKIRLKQDIRPKRKQPNNCDDTISHHALIFNVTYDTLTERFLTTSLDGNLIFWDCQVVDAPEDSMKRNSRKIVEVRSRFLYPSMPNNSRTHMLRHSPIREDLFAIALGKAGIRFYQVAESSDHHRFDMNQSRALISRKISKFSVSPTSVAWHPSHEYRLAIGTLEGKVYRADLAPRKANLIEAENKPSIAQTKPDCDIFDVGYEPAKRPTGDEKSALQNQDNPEQLKTDGVYSLCWGPNPAFPQDLTRLAIYSIGSISHRLFIYSTCSSGNKDNSERLSNYLDEFSDESLPEASGKASEVSWKQTLDLMALGTTDGRIIIVSYLDEAHCERDKKLFQKIAIIEGLFGSSYIQCIAWHPTGDNDDINYLRLAASSNESPVFVFNLRDLLIAADVRSKLKLEDRVMNTQLDRISYQAIPTLSSYEYRLDGHKKAVSDVAWNPHEPNELATASFDRQCYVWSLKDDHKIESEVSDTSQLAYIKSKFSARDRLFTLDWSLVDDDLIFTSGHDSTLWAWRPSENRWKLGDTT